MPTLKELSQIPERLVAGHRLCAGCGASIAVRQILMATKNPVVVGCSTGCLEVATTIYPYTAWKTPWIHNAFENVASTISGAETAYRALKKRGRLPIRVDSRSSNKISDDLRFIAFGGDGGTYDIGIQALSGVLERGHRMVYVCYDNEAYMNTGIQRSGATPLGASTTTAPAGKVKPGKEQFRKDLTAICAAHHIPYVAQATIWPWSDLVKKAEKAFNANGPAFLNVLCPCPRGWRFPGEKTVEIAKLAIQTGFWPLYEVENGVLRITYPVKKRKPLLEWIKSQGRYKHLLKPGNEKMLEAAQANVDATWKRLESGKLV